MPLIRIPRVVGHQARPAAIVRHGIAHVRAAADLRGQRFRGGAIDRRLELQQGGVAGQLPRDMQSAPRGCGKAAGQGRRRTHGAGRIVQFHDYSAHSVVARCGVEGQRQSQAQPERQSW